MIRKISIEGQAPTDTRFVDGQCSWLGLQTCDRLQHATPGRVSFKNIQFETARDRETLM